MLCDCPGLVFPQFATTKAELVCDGVLPIDQLREYTGPTSLVVRRIPKAVLEAVYGLTIRTISVEEGGDGQVKAEDLLIAYASRSIVRLLYSVLTERTQLQEDLLGQDKEIRTKHVLLVIS